MSQLWKELHERAASFVGTDDRQFVNLWGAKIPRFTQGCSCNEFWKNWVTVNPPVFTPPNAYFEWTVKAHNGVNAKLKKKIWTIEEARAEWGNPSRTIISTPTSTPAPISKPVVPVAPVPKPIVTVPKPVESVVYVATPVAPAPAATPVPFHPQNRIPDSWILPRQPRLPSVQPNRINVPAPNPTAPSKQSHNYRGNPSFKRWSLTQAQLAEIERNKQK